MSLLVISEILGPFVNTLTANDKYFFHQSENLQQQIQMHLSLKQIFFVPVFSTEICIKFSTIWKKMALIAYVFLKLQSEKEVVR